MEVLSKCPACFQGDEGDTENDDVVLIWGDEDASPRR
jgi:hypothetical protein